MADQKPPSRPGSSGSSSTHKHDEESFLGPVRTGHETPTSDRFSVTPVKAADTPDQVPIEIKKKEPLPPIGQQDQLETDSDETYPIDSISSSVIDENEAGENADDLDSEMSSTESDSANSMAGSGPAARRPGGRPRVVAYRRETEGGNVPPPKSANAGRGITFADRPFSPATKEVTTVKGIDGSEHVMVSIDCQTDWSFAPEDTATPGPPEVVTPSRVSRASIRSNTRKTTISPASARSSRGQVQSSQSGQIPAETTTASEATVSPVIYPPQDDTYGIPVLQISSDTDSSDDESYPTYREEQDKAKSRETLPSIGPPQILQYQRESSKVAMSVGAPEDQDVTDGEGEFSGVTQGGMFEGPCEFCGNPIKPFPTLEMQKQHPPEMLYCCDDYREFVHFSLTHPLHALQNQTTMIDIKPHPHHGSRQARRAAKERAAQRMRERELARQQAAAANLSAGATTNFMQFARQMKTINYQLSSQKCLEEGWTLRPPSPLLDMEQDTEVFEPQPVKPPWARSQGKGKDDGGIILKYYSDGSKYLIICPDGTGNVFYPSGQVAVSISSTETGLYTYVVQDDEEDNNLIAVFDTTGYGFCYHKTGDLRVYYDQLGGTELDINGGRKRKWTWKDQVQHVHAPPIQPITFAVTKQLALRIMGQESITLTFSSLKRSCRFHVGAKLKVVAPQYMPEPSVDEDQLFRDSVKQRVDTILSKVSNLLKFPKSPKLDKLSLPSHVSGRYSRLERASERSGSRIRSARKRDQAPVVSVN